jgi:hypothetical protein
MAEALTEAQRQALQEAKDAKARKLEGEAPTTSTTMGEGRLGGSKPPEKKAKGGTVGSASRRADGIAQRGKTKGRFV